MSNETFPLWKLPQVPRKLVFQLIDIIDLLEISMTSRPVRKFLTAFKPHLVDLTWKFDDSQAIRRYRVVGPPPYETYMYLQLYFPCSKQEITYYFVGKNKARSSQERAVNWKEDVVMKCMNKKEMYERQGFMVGGRDDCRRADPGNPDLKIMEDLSTHLTQILRINSYNVKHLRLSEFDFFGCFVWNITKKFKKFVAKNVEINKEATRFILKDLEIEDVEIMKNCKWITINDVMESESKKIKIRFPNDMNVDELVKLVNLWKSGNILRDMKSLSLEGPFDVEKMLLQEHYRLKFFKKLGIIGKRPDRNVFENDIKRDTDGQMARLFFCGRQMTLDLKETTEKKVN
ncbi:hypothetical protein CRE_19297 [Caenorhabditis remanei]|uniref:F-box domain-containing protein n=1 Tax=Caenorhabditis remanei TaxID=31234 RepID=E3MX91_CAERE|nr:hypothetical protein CRE_19297 [Caenorhabditis remanei]